MKKILSLSLLLFFSVQAWSQTFEVPKNYKLEAKEDYAQYEDDVIASVNWLLQTPVTEEEATRKEVNAFLMKWLTGSPNVSIGLSEDIVTFMDCPDCLMAFMGGWAKYALENKDHKNQLKGNIAGIENLIMFYQKNKDIIGRNKAIEKYVKLKEKNKLEDYIRSKV